MAIYIISVSSHLHSSFSYLNISQSTANIIVSAVFCFWSAPLALGESFTHNALISQIPGHLILFSWWVALISHLAVSCNRLIAATRPTDYSKIFATRNTKIIIIFAWIVSFSYSLIYEIDGCNFCFNRVSLRWQYTETPCGVILSNYLDLFACILLIVSVFIIDITTLIVLKRTKPASIFMFWRTILYARRKKEIIFYIQVFIKNFVKKS
ncbi:unnamed protein product [Dracunculus medinensis]|uniref:G_PROTEIN_RECEP_F1_2 domain-containing protein n=1 Tax=Dracunculus medinensis TaxID=318479 RepID=A0A0N4U0H6_DRAME|nr:unnamed protein product [Dracunculus medinensis]